MSTQPPYQPPHGPYPTMPVPPPRKRRRIWLPALLAGIACLVFLGGCLAMVVGAVDDAATPAPVATPMAPTAEDEPTIAEPEPTEPATTTKPTPTQAKPTVKPMTTSQENAVETATDYIEGDAFSRKGLIEQLEYEEYPKADCVFAVKWLEHRDLVDWRVEAAQSAKSYLEGGSFSRKGLIEQLESEYGEQFTHAQAVYGVDQAGL